jgi:hypothetical protein
MKSLFLPSLILAALCAPAFCQVAVSVGPSPAPVGCAVAISVSNDSGSAIALPNPCPFRVRNESGGAVFTPACDQMAITPVFAGSVFTAMWHQVDDSGNQVPAGMYLVDVLFPGGTSTTSLMIDAATQAGIGQVGPTRIGTTRSLWLCAPGSIGLPYLMAASGPAPSGGIRTCAGVVPLEIDPLFEMSLGANPFFSNFSGILQEKPTESAPSITVPNEPALIGVKFVIAFVVIDSNAPCVIRTISAPHLIFIV